MATSAASTGFPFSGGRPWGSTWTPLLQSSVAESSEINYRRGVRYFLEWLDAEYPAFAITTAAQMDDALAEYGWEVFE